MKKVTVIAIAALMLLSTLVPAFATPEKAKDTGKKCSECHQKKDGGHGTKPAGPHAKK